MDHNKSLWFLTLLFIAVSTYSQTTGSFQIGGSVRSYIVYAPSGLMKPALVINMHGIGGTAAQLRSYVRLDQVATREGFIVVYPDGLNNTWDITGNVDVTFISALIDSLYSQYGIDRSRVYATGFSMGGYMSHRLGCALSSKIAAIASVAGLNASYNCTVTRPVPVLQIHGTADSTVKYSGVQTAISGWVTRNGCSSIPVLTSPYPQSRPQSVVRKSSYGPGTKNCEVVLLTVEGGTHSWFNTADINSSEEIWAFLKNHTLEGTISVLPRVILNTEHRSITYANKTLHLNNLPDLLCINITSLTGRLSSVTNVNNMNSGNVKTLDLSGMTPGVYIVTARQENRVFRTRINVD